MKLHWPNMIEMLTKLKKINSKHRYNYRSSLEVEKGQIASTSHVRLWLGSVLWDSLSMLMLLVGYQGDKLKEYSSVYFKQKKITLQDTVP